LEEVESALNTFLLSSHAIILNKEQGNNEEAPDVEDKAAVVVWDCDGMD